jgi:UDP-N-acetylglucosamine:LPS N-acetylglucosamine transferase
VRLAFAGGGTGGHIAPGKRVLEAIAASDEHVEDLVWFTSGRAVEDLALQGVDELIGEGAWERIVGRMEPAGGGAPGILRIASRLLPEIWAARRALLRHQSQALLGLGGFSALAPVLAARSLGIPCAWLEVNTLSGRATRVLAPRCERVWHAWESTTLASPGHEVVGPPLEACLFEPATEEARRAKRLELGLNPEAPLVVVLGGSQGALGLNTFVAENAHGWVGAGLNIVHQCGPGRTNEGAGALAGYLSVEFIDDVPAVLASADLALARAGASTVAEIGAARLPAIFVPHPASPDRHQHKNAGLLGEGARVVDQAELSPQFARELLELAGDGGTEERAKMRLALEGAVPSGGASRVAAGLIALSRAENS